MHNSYTEPHPAVTKEPADPQRAGATLSVVGLIVWLLAMALAVAGPLLGLAIPPLLIIGMVVFSGLFSLFSLPRMLGMGGDRD